MIDLTRHYRDLLGLDQAWIVDDVDLDLSGSQVITRVSHARGKLYYPECGQECPRADTAPERSWRHLDTMQFAVYPENLAALGKLVRRGRFDLAVNRRRITGFAGKSEEACRRYLFAHFVRVLDVMLELGLRNFRLLLPAFRLGLVDSQIGEVQTIIVTV